MKRLISVLVIFGAAGCAQNGQDSGFPVRVTSQSPRGLPVEIKAVETKPLPVQLETDAEKPVPVKMDVSDLPMSAVVIATVLLGALVLLSVFAFFVSILAWRTALQARRTGGKREDKAAHEK